MRIPNSMDTKRIKRDGKHFTVEPRSALDRQHIMICDNCAREKCRIYNYMNRQISDGYSMKVMECESFIPALGFSVLDGLDLPYWNTIRVGGAWANRLLPKHVVAIIDTKNSKVVGHARVESTHAGTLSQMVEKHARMNHAMKHEVMHGKTLPVDSEIQARMMRILKNANGTNIAAPDRQASVIYLVRD